jgi:ABC-type sulfate transport system permease component
MRFDFGDFLWRWAIALVLVFVTFNPTGTSYLHWVLEDLESGLPYKALAGLVLLVGYIIFLRATFRSIGIVGIALIAAVFAAIVWILADQQVFDPANQTILTWIVLVAIATIMGVGVSWSHVRRRIAGQADVDDVEY